MGDQQQLQDQDAAESSKAKGKGKPKKDLKIPPELKEDSEKWEKIHEFMETYDCFNDHHKERLMAAMVCRMDTFMADLETLMMAMGGAKKAGGSEAALLVSLIKQMEDGEFKARDE